MNPRLSLLISAREIVISCPDLKLKFMIQGSDSDGWVPHDLN
jgi:hypothetical protein